MKSRAAFLLAVVVLVAGCGGDERDPDEVALVRIAVPADVPMNESVTAQLAVSEDGCLQLVGVRHSSVWWSGVLDVAVVKERLLIDGLDRGAVGRDGITVRLTGRDYPTSPVGLDVSGPYSEVCNQLAPFTASGIDVVS